MNIEYYFNGKNNSIKLPDNTLVIEPLKVKLRNGQDLLRNALKNPFDSCSFYDFLSNKKKILILVNDGTRPTPTAQVLSFLKDDLKNKHVKILVATGTHRLMNESEKHKILGSTYDIFKNCISSHDSQNRDRLKYVGVTSRNTEIYINKAIYESDGIIVIGSVEPHYFAGFTGGRKSIMPGIAGFASIEMNHKLALEKEAKVLNLENNPVNEDMNEVISLLNIESLFSIQIVMDKDHNIFDVTAGDLNSSFYKAVEVAKKVFTFPIKEKADIVITVAKDPMDINFYQSQKAYDNAKFALKKNGIMILVSACKEGIGNKDFYELMAKAKTPKEVFEKIKTEYHLGYHKSAKISEVLMDSTVFVVSTLDSKIWENIFFKSFNSLEDALCKAFSKKGDNANVIIMLDGGITVPIIE
ncbi:MAG: nickel-dependent lactate racemase [Sphaerochaetaceae bacterium]|nr:nickel-dependent lactate racemase [Sphaerochaetaceae bacterium]